MLSVPALLAAFLTQKQFFKQNLISAIRMLGGFFVLSYTQHLQSTQFFKELFTEFNARYNAINEKLARISSADTDLDEDERNLLIDYLNLCSEEYYFYASSYIDPGAWESWRRGIQAYLRVPKIRAFFQEELKNGSYYGINLQIIEKA